MKDKVLTVEVTDEGLLSITIGVDTLAFALKNSPTDGIMTYDDEKDEYYGLNITDNIEFAKEFIQSVSREDEIGETPLTRFIDKSVIDGLDLGIFLSVDLDKPVKQNV